MSKELCILFMADNAEGLLVFQLEKIISVTNS